MKCLFMCKSQHNSREKFGKLHGMRPLSLGQALNGRTQILYKINI